MKQIIPFVNDISLDNRIYEITSIALEHNLQMENSDSIVGVFTISGKYKMNELSVNEEVFEKNLEFDITLDDKYDASKVKIDIDDFYYEIVNDEILRVHIAVVVDNLVYFKEEKIDRCIEDEEDINNISNDNKINQKDSDIMLSDTILEDKENKIVEDIKDDMLSNRKDKLEDFSSNLLIEKEEYITYKVHIIRDDETINTLIEKYNISKEEIEKYNNIENVTIGSKIIIPIINE